MHQIDHAYEEQQCRNRSDESPIAPYEIQVLAEVKRALQWLCGSSAWNAKSNVHRLIPLSGNGDETAPAALNLLLHIGVDGLENVPLVFAKTRQVNGPSHMRQFDADSIGTNLCATLGV
jgi:hypothetical protein